MTNKEEIDVKEALNEYFRLKDKFYNELIVNKKNNTNAIPPYLDCGPIISQEAKQQKLIIFNISIFFIVKCFLSFFEKIENIKIKTVIKTGTSNL